MKAHLHHIDEITNNIKTFWFEVSQPAQWTPGQFTELSLKHGQPDDRGIKRWFTISSSPTDGMMSITTRYAGDNGSTFKRALFSAEPGQEVDLAEPMGDFVLPKLIQTPLLFVAGGIGITPFHSMFRWLASTGEVRDIRFIHAVRTEDDIIFQEDANAAGVDTTIVVSEPSDSWGGERGRVSAETILGIDKPSDDTLIYLSGPEPMLEALERDLETHGVDKKQLVTDFFPGYPGI